MGLGLPFLERKRKKWVDKMGEWSEKLSKMRFSGGNIDFGCHGQAAGAEKDNRSPWSH